MPHLEVFHAARHTSEAGHQVRAQVSSSATQLTLTPGSGPVPEQDVITAQAIAQHHGGGIANAMMGALIRAQEIHGGL